MDRLVLKECLTGYDTWELEQDNLDNRFILGELTKYEYVYASLELLAEHMPIKDSGVKSLVYK